MGAAQLQKYMIKQNEYLQIRKYIQDWYIVPLKGNLGAAQLQKYMIKQNEYLQTDAFTWISLLSFRFTPFNPVPPTILSCKVP